MKLRFKHSPLPLDEAGDINKGHRLNYVKKYCEALSKCLQANKYKLKLHSDKISGFEILPISNYLVAFKLSLATKDNSVDMQIYRCTDDLSNNTIRAIELGKVTSNNDITNIISKLEQLVKSHWNSLILSSDYLKEDYNTSSLSEANIFTNIKNAIDMHAAKKDQKTAEKQAEKDATSIANAILEPTRKKLESIIKELGPDYTTTSKANDTDFYVFVQAPYIASVNFQPDMKDLTKVIVSSLLGSDQKEVNIKDTSLTTVTELLVKKLSLVNQIDSLSEFLTKSDAAGSTSANKTDDSDTSLENDSSTDKNYMIPQIAGGLKSLSRDEIKQLLGENAQINPRHDWITEAVNITLKNNVKPADYMKVYKDIDRTSKNGQLAINALVMRFINKAFNISSNTVEKLVQDSKSFITYRDALIESQFNPADVSNPVLYILSTYLIRTKKLVSSIVDGIRRFFSDSTVSQLAQKATKNKDHIKNESIFYVSDLATVGVPFDLFTCYYLLETPTYSNILTKCTQDTDIRSSIARILNVEPESLADADVKDLKHHILYSGDHIRKSKDIKAIVSNLSKLKDVGKSSTSYTDFADDGEAVAVEMAPDDVKAALKDVTRSSPIELKSFINVLALELKSKRDALSEEDLLALQKKLFKAFNADSE